MIRDHLFVISASQPWATCPKEPMQLLAQAICMENRVLYVNPPVYPLTLLGRTEKVGKIEHGRTFERLSPTLWVLDPPLVLPTVIERYEPALFDKMNLIWTRRFAEIIQKALTAMGHDEFYLVCDNNPLCSLRLPELLHPAVTIYHRLSHVAYPETRPALRRHSLRLDATLARRSDIVVTYNDHVSMQMLTYNMNTFNFDSPGGEQYDPWLRRADRLYAAIALGGPSDAGDELPFPDLLVS